MSRPHLSISHDWWQYTLAILVVGATLGGCSFTGANQAAQTPVALPTYQPAGAGAGTSGTEAAAAPATGAQTTKADAATVTSTAASANTASGVAAASSATTPAAAASNDAAPSSNASAGSRYQAEIVADKQVVVMSQVNGQIMDVAVDVGDHVMAGDVLVKLDTAALEAQRAQALASLEAAKSQLDLLQDPAKDKDLAAARAAVAAASAAYDRANNGPTAEEKRLALAQLKQSEAAITVAQAAYNVVKGNPNIGMLPQSLQLEQATLANEAAQAQYDKILKGATEDQIAGAYAQVASASAQLQRLLDGAKPAQVQAAEAQVHAAETALYLAQLQLNKATITAPMDGTVSRLQAAAGGMAAPAAPLLTLLSDNMRVTIAVEETRLPELKIGQQAQIQVEAYPDRVIAGEVAIIAPELDPTTRTVQVTIQPTDADGLLQPGMSASAELLSN